MKLITLLKAVSPSQKVSIKIGDVNEGLGVWGYKLMFEDITDHILSTRDPLLSRSNVLWITVNQGTINIIAETNEGGNK